MKSNILVAGVAATTAMIVFSYMVSRNKGKNYREPELLAQLTSNLIPAMRKRGALPAGFAMHYGMGQLFSAAQYAVFQKLKTDPSIKNGFSAGIITGITGVAIWKMTIEAHPNPPEINQAGFFKHLMFAHTVFSTTFNLCLKGYRRQ